MFYDSNLLNIFQNGKFAKCWLAATCPTLFRARHRKDDVIKTQIHTLCDEILEQWLIDSCRASERLSLFLASQLMYGTVCIYQQQVIFLYENAAALLCQENFVLRNLTPKRKLVHKESEYLPRKRIKISKEQPLNKPIVENIPTNTVATNDAIVLREIELEDIAINIEEDFGQLGANDEEELLKILDEQGSANNFSLFYRDDVPRHSENLSVNDLKNTDNNINPLILESAELYKNNTASVQKDQTVSSQQISINFPRNLNNETDILKLNENSPILISNFTKYFQKRMRHQSTPMPHNLQCLNDKNLTTPSNILKAESTFLNVISENTAEIQSELPQISLNLQNEKNRFLSDTQENIICSDLEFQPILPENLLGKRKHIKIIDINKELTNKQMCNQIKNCDNTLRCKEAIEDVMTLWEIEKRKKYFEIPAHRIHSRDFLKRFLRTPKTPKTDIDHHIMDVIYYIDGTEVLLSHNKRRRVTATDIRKNDNLPPLDTEISEIIQPTNLQFSDTNPKIISKIIQPTQLKFSGVESNIQVPVEVTQHQESSEIYPKIISEITQSNQLKFSDAEPNMQLPVEVTQSQGSLNEINTNIEEFCVPHEKKYDINIYTDFSDITDEIMNKLKLLWRKHKIPIQMKDLCVNAKSKKHAAQIFFTLLCLAKDQIIKLSKDFGCADIYHIYKGINYMEYNKQCIEIA